MVDLGGILAILGSTACIKYFERSGMHIIFGMDTTSLVKIIFELFQSRWTCLAS